MSSCENRQLVSAVKIIFIRDRYKTLDRKEKKLDQPKNSRPVKKNPTGQKLLLQGGRVVEWFRVLDLKSGGP